MADINSVLKTLKRLMMEFFLQEKITVNSGQISEGEGSLPTEKEIQALEETPIVKPKRKRTPKTPAQKAAAVKKAAAKKKVKEE